MDKASTAVDVTNILLQIAGIIAGVAVPVFLAWARSAVNSYVKDKEMAKLLDNVLNNAVGKIQMVGRDEIKALDPQVQVPNWILPGVQYALDHGKEALDHFGVTDQAAIADKLIARIGVKNIESNIALTQSAVPLSVNPLAPVPAVVAVMPPVAPEDVPIAHVQV